MLMLYHTIPDGCLLRLQKRLLIPGFDAQSQILFLAAVLGAVCLLGKHRWPWRAQMQQTGVASKLLARQHVLADKGAMLPRDDPVKTSQST